MRYRKASVIEWPSGAISTSVALLSFSRRQSVVMHHAEEQSLFFLCHDIFFVFLLPPRPDVLHPIFISPCAVVLTKRLCQPAY